MNIELINILSSTHQTVFFHSIFKKPNGPEINSLKKIMNVVYAFKYNKNVLSSVQLTGE